MTSLAFLPFKRYLMSFIFLCFIFIFYFSFLLINNTSIPWQKQLTAWHGDKEVSCSVPQRNRIEPMLPNCAEIKEPWRWLGEWCCCLQFCKIPFWMLKEMDIYRENCRSSQYQQKLCLGWWAWRVPLKSQNTNSLFFSYKDSCDQKQKSLK